MGMGSRGTDTETDTAAARLHALHAYFRQHPVTGPEGHSFTAFTARTPPAASPVPFDTGVVELIDAAVAEVVHHTRTVNPDAGPLPARVEDVYAWAREHTTHAPHIEQQRRDTIEYRQRLEHAIAAGDSLVVRPHRCPACRTLGLYWPPEAGRDPHAKAVCVNRRCAEGNGGLSRSWSLARLAYERIAEKTARECAT